MTGRICVICPVSSNTMTEVDIVCVTDPANAAAPEKTQKNNKKINFSVQLLSGGEEGGKGPPENMSPPICR